MLYVLMSNDEGRDLVTGTTQRDLRARLGVSASVVSRMVASIQELGWVTRRIEPHDRRQRLVTLTSAGLQCIATAFKVLRRASWRLVHLAICFGKHRNPSAQFVHTQHLEGYLHGIREQYGDTAPLILYRWHPDD
jgi:DNA-binding MarR family transcriptional regulator